MNVSSEDTAAAVAQCNVPLLQQHVMWLAARVPQTAALLVCLVSNKLK
jgi:hypothetical protein